MACAALEPHFWNAFCAVIGLPKELVLDTRDPDATRAAIQKIIAAETSDYWRPKLAEADCCVTIVATLEEALADRHFVERGLFAHKVEMPNGQKINAMPLPIEPSLRVEDEVRPFPVIKR